MNAKIGKQIKILRNRDGVTQDRLADALGVTSQAISKWENEVGYPDIEYIVPIANFFNVTIDTLFEHDRSESENKINEYCEKLDEMHRNLSDVNTRIDLARQALAEFPAEEKLLVRLATVLWEKWSEDVSNECFLFVEGKTVYNFDKARATEGWEEAAQIMEKLLATSTNDSIRSECRDILIRLYGQIGEKEKVYKLADYCPDCKAANLFAAFSGKYNEEARENSQRLLQSALFRLRVHLPIQTKDLTLKAKAIEKIIELHKFVFDDENYEFSHVKMEQLYIDYADVLLQQERMDEVFSALDKAASSNHTTLTQLFKKVLEMTPIEYVWHYRLVLSKKFLEFTNLPIKDIASRCGFKTPQHFSRKFEERFGDNPTTFRTVAVERRKKSF